MDNIRLFYEEIVKSKELAEKIESINANYADEQLAEDDRLKIIENEIIPIAKEHGFDFSIQELIDYSKPDMTVLNEDDLDSIDGGIITKNVDSKGNTEFFVNGQSANGGCFLAGGAVGFKDYNIETCACVIGGGGIFKYEKDGELKSAARIICPVSGFTTSNFKAYLAQKYQEENPQ